VQQAPMVGTSDAYQTQIQAQTPVTQPVMQNQVSAQPYYQATATTQQQTPIQDVKPSWQQELQYNVPENLPWSNQVETQQTRTVNSPEQRSWSQYSAPALSSQIAPETYSLLTEPLDYTANEPVPKSKGKRILKVVIILILLLLVTGGVGYAAYIQGFKKGVILTQQAMEEQMKQTEQDQTNSDQTQDPNLQLDDTTDTNTISTPKEKIEFTMKNAQYIDETKDGAVGQVVEAADGFVMKVLNVERDYKPAGSNSTGAFIKINLIVGNSDNNRSKYIKPDSFIVTDENGEIIGNYASDIEYHGKLTMPYELKAGDQVQYSMVYQLTNNSPSIQFIRSQPYVVGGSNKLMIIIIPV